MIRRSNTKAWKYKRQIQCNRITKGNQKIKKTNIKHVKNYRSSRTPEDGRPLRSSITLWAEQLNIRFLLYESLVFSRAHSVRESPNKAPWRQFLGSLPCAAAQKQRLVPRLWAAPLFAFLLAAQFIFEFTVLQLTGECFAPPSAMICAVAMSSADSGMGVGSSS